MWYLLHAAIAALIGLPMLVVAPRHAAAAPPDRVGYYADGTKAKKGGARLDKGLPLARVIADKKKLAPAAIGLTTAKHFRFTFGRGSGRDGYDTLIVEGSRAATYLYRARRGYSWRLARYTLSARDLAALRAGLAQRGYLQLHKSYSARVWDGAQWFFKLESGSHKKGVYCDNYFPLRVRALAAWIGKRFVAPYRKRWKERKLSGWHKRWLKLVGSETFK